MTTSSSGFPIGHALVTVFTNGIPSQSQIIRAARVPVAQSAVSRKTHGAAGPFDIALPLTGTPGIECRSAGGTSDYTMVVTFASNVTVAGNPQAQVIVRHGLRRQWRHLHRLSQRQWRDGHGAPDQHRQCADD